MLLRKLLTVIVIDAGLFILYGLYYFVYNIALYDDLKELVGKHAIRKYKNTTKFLLKRVLFWKLYPYVIKWHYIIFVFYLVCATVSTAILDISFFVDCKQLNTLFIFLFLSCTCSTFLMGFVRWSRYKFNITRERTSRKHNSNSAILRKNFYDEFK